MYSDTVCVCGSAEAAKEARGKERGKGMRTLAIQVFGLDELRVLLDTARQQTLELKDTIDRINDAEVKITCEPPKTNVEFLYYCDPDKARATCNIARCKYLGYTGFGACDSTKRAEYAMTIDGKLLVSRAMQVKQK